MRYSVPVNAASEVAALAAAGATELYCGYMDAWWITHYGDHDSASRRQGAANIQTSKELRATVEAARNVGIPLHLALNTRYTEPMLDHLEELCTRFEEWGGTGVILSDLGLIWRLRNRENLVRTLSILAVAQNTATIQAYASLGIARIVLPRFLEPSQAASLLRENPNVEATSMAFFDKCPWVDGYCRHRHGVSYPDRQATSDGDVPPLFTFDTTYRTHACLGTVCNYLVPYPCAACQLTAFEDAGVGTAKLGGRGRPLEERLRVLRFLQSAQQLDDDLERQTLYRTTFGCECSCYYGPYAQRRDAIESVAMPPLADGRQCMGSETSPSVFVSTLTSISEKDPVSCVDDSLATTLLVPPLSNEEQRVLMDALPAVVARLPRGSHVAVNDLGTLVLVAHALESLDDNAHALPTLTLGTLLARLDDPNEVEHFLSPKQNPSRPVYDLNGNPRTLEWAAPPQTLVNHWRHPSNTEPSAQQALMWLCKTDGIPFEARCPA